MEAAMRGHTQLFWITMCMLVGLSIQASAANESRRNRYISVTPVAGESWIRHLHRSFGATSMGKTGRLGPPASPDGVQPAGWQLGFLPSPPEAVELHGEDLYRFNCQGCHGESGLGASPEINSVINPVRATSVPLVLDRMKKAGMEMTPAAASELAKQAQEALLQRLHNGGQSMPPFPHLDDDEIRVLIAYLRKLADVPGASQLAIVEPPEKIGEHIVKSTCHTCHDATGSNPNPEQLEKGAIPPLQTLPTRVDEIQFIRKVTAGAPILMGNPPSLHRGRMPVFYYLTRQEAADVYLYLTATPPAQAAVVTAVAAGRQDGDGDNTASSSPLPPVPPTSLRTQSNSSPRQSQGIPDWAVMLALAGSGVFSMAIVIGGLGFAAYEMHRLAHKGKNRSPEASLDAEVEEEVRDLVAR
jgi:mono/diheme cytochrome c family protein